VISLVVAVAENGVIGMRGGLPWRIKADLKRFRSVTMGKPIVMGRKTFDSIGRVLDGRDNIVVTRRADTLPEGAFLARSVEAALKLAEACALRRGVNEICVIGGEALFRDTLPLAERLYVTHVAAAPAGDVFFPAISPADWVERSRETLPASDGDTAAATYLVYERRR
jgi:dihydrofolate reductase